MRSQLFFIVVWVCFACQPERPSVLEVQNLTCEHAVAPLGIENPSPAFGWQLRSDDRHVLQKKYRLLVASCMTLLADDVGDYWDSGKVASDRSIQVGYAGKPLQPATTYYWKVKVWDNHGHASAWSEPQSWQMGLLSVADWGGAQWIALDEQPADRRVYPGIRVYDGRVSHLNLGDMTNRLPLLRRDFRVDNPLKKATAFISGMGQFELVLNGKKVGDHFLDPGWTKYNKYALYVTFDITAYLREGANVCGILLGNGFYHSPLERYIRGAFSHGFPKAICKMVFEYANGSVSEIVTDNSWKASPSPITFSAMFGGEGYDARLEQDGWNQPGFDDSGWPQALTVSGPPQLRAQTIEPLKVMETFDPKAIFQAKNGDWVYDLGQNFSGIVRISAKGKAGQIIQMWPGELINNDSIVMQNATGAPFYFDYTLAGRDEESWQPRFTYYGFRYVLLKHAVPQGVPNPKGLPVVTRLQGLHTRLSAPPSGTFSCSNALFNRIYTLIDWSIRSNLMSVLTDCPHREKLGWLEQVHLMGNSIQYNYNISRLFNKVVDDMRASQEPNGFVPNFVPDIYVSARGYRDSPEWGSAYIITPWYYYQWYGDKRPLQNHYEDMKRYLDYLTSKAENHIIAYGLGDWFDLGPNTPGESQLTSRGVTATAIYYYNVCLMKKAAQVLKKAEDEVFFTDLAVKIKKAFNEQFYKSDLKQYDRGSQTAHAMAIYMDLVAPENRQAVFNHLLKDLEGRNYSFTPGDIGFRYLLRVLQSEGASETIFLINNRDDVPGYGYQLAKGATALTESWAALRTVSNNHCMLGHLMEWFYSGLAGIRQADHSVAYRDIVIKPEVVGDITRASASYECPYGTIVSEWRKEGDHFYLNVDIPANTSAIIYFPGNTISGLTESGVEKKFKTTKDGAVKIGSGRYQFKL